MGSPDVSVVIGFRDWGPDRLQRSVESLSAAGSDLNLEVIVSDYGSRDPSVSEGVARATGVRWISTPGDPHWSRSRALNAGFRVARGKVLVSTDADMVFAPGTLQAVHDTVRKAGPCAVFLQCRDLSADITHRLLGPSLDVPWAQLAEGSRLRPRWGMGGLMAIDVEGFRLLHGFDERMHTYGREDLDFALRARRAGRRTVWVDDGTARMFHLWHPASGDVAAATGDGRDAMARNREIVDHDMTTSRNITSSTAPTPGGPLVSVIVEPGALEASQRTVATALAQSVRDLEVVVCGQPAAGAHLTRVRYVPEQGAAAGNVAGALETATGSYAMILSAGDLLALDGIEKLLEAVVDGTVGAVGQSAPLKGVTVPTDAPSTGNLDQVLARRDVLVTAHALLDDASTTVRDALDLAGLRLGTAQGRVVLTPARGETGPARVHDAETDEPLLLQLVGCDGSFVDLVLAASPLPDAETMEILGDLEPGAAEIAELRRGDETILGSLLLRHPTLAALATIADAASTVSLTAADEAGIPDGSWVDAVVTDALRRGHRTPFEIHHGGGAGPARDTYRFRSLQESMEIHLAAPSDSSHVECRRWILIGGSTLEAEG